MRNEPASNLQPYPLPTYAYWCMPMFLFLLAALHLHVRCLPRDCLTIPIWGWVLVGLYTLLVGIPGLVSFARIWYDVAVSSALFPNRHEIRLFFVRTILIHKLPATISGQHKWFAWLYYGAWVLFFLSAFLLFAAA